MWYNPGPNTVYSGGGWHYDGAENYTLWSFQPDGKGGASWNQDVIGDLYTQQYIPTIGSAFTASNTSFYSLGGADSTVNDVASDLDLALQGLVTQEAATGIWSNYSSTGASHSGRSVFAEAVFMPSFGQGGLLAFVGGESPANSTYHYNPTSTDTAFVSMSNITIYDPNTSTWYHQKATGKVPPPRSQFCAVGNGDSATFEIYVFGGATSVDDDEREPTDIGYTDVYVLSLPSFTWFQATAPTELRRANHFCQVIGNSQMLVIGGRNPSETGNPGVSFGTNGDPWTRHMRIFDMVNWRWTNTYNHTAVYTRPEAIQQHYSSAANSPNWSSPSLESLFPANSLFSANPASSSVKPAASHTGAIVGGVVGGVALLAIVLAVVSFYCMRRRKHSRLASLEAEHDHAEPNYWEPVHEMPLVHERKSLPAELSSESESRSDLPRME